MRIVIIDSGISGFEAKKDINGVTIDYINGKQVVTNQIDDEIGHGTAVAGIVESNLQGEYQLFVIKVFSQSYQTSEKQLYAALMYILENLDCSVVLISSGIRMMEYYYNIETCINSLVDRNVIVVAAFDNNGAISYPAAFNRVIGVDTYQGYKDKNQFALVYNSDVNVMGSGVSFRTKGLSGKKIIVKGSSYTAAYVASLIARHIINVGHNISLDECMDYLRQMATDIIALRRKDVDYNPERFVQDVKKAIVFPFNKEMHSIAKFEEMLMVKIHKYYDVKYSGMVGVRICDFFPHIKNTAIIEDFLDINWEGDFDAVILGHVQELSALIGFDLQKWFLEKCRIYRKKIYCFDKIDCIAKSYLNQENYFYPMICKENFPENYGGKLHLLRTPVLGVWGTSSKQGKHTLQIMLRKLFISNGYNVGQLGTEPSAYLFGFDYAYPMGYNSTVYVQGNEAIGVLNNIMRQIDMRNVDIIIVGSQSGTIHRVNYNLKYFSVVQTEFLMGTQPDIIILCINVYDDLSYIEKTKNFIESISGGKVIAFCLSPLKASINNGAIKKNGSVSEEEALVFADNVEAALGKPVYFLGQSESIECLYHSILEYLL